MKVRTLETLIDEIDSDFAWRRKELSVISNQVKSAQSIAIGTNLRIGIVMLYAHWEGFIKNAAELYLNFVSTRGLKLEELSSCFVAIALKERLSNCENSNKSTIHTQTLDFIFANMSKAVNIPKKDIIKTQSNLNSDILREILSTIGIDYSPYELKANLIDSQLLRLRNTIAHGQFLELGKEEFDLMYFEISSILTDVKDKISNAATLALYKKQNY